MNPRNLTREAIEQLNDIEPYCFETDREEQWFKVGLQYGLDAADKEPLIHWISVKDDLPCNHEELTEGDNTSCVLTLNDCDECIVMCMWKSNRKWIWGRGDMLITHWMRLPELPKE